MDSWFQVLRILADAQIHSGEKLAEHLGVSRAAVWKQIKHLDELPGVEVETIRGSGYRLSAPLDLLDEDQITSHLAPLTHCLEAVHLLPLVDSTNSFLSALSPSAPDRGIACLAEHQTAGRGRRGRNWVTGFGRNLSFSLTWQFDLPLSALSGLSLAVGVAISRVLTELGIEGHGLKWPNDIYLGKKKLGGILVEAQGEADGPVRAVIGVGLNLELPEDLAGDIDQPWADLSGHKSILPGRSELAARLIESLTNVCLEYPEYGLPHYLSDWSDYDIFLGHDVQILHGHNSVVGLYSGIDVTGALRLQVDGQERIFHSGEVSLRQTEVNADEC